MSCYGWKEISDSHDLTLARVLPIYRITNDRITNLQGVEVKPDGARGLAMSGIITAGYNFNVRSGIKLIVGP